MQLKKPAPIKKALSLATLTLLGVSPAAALAEDKAPKGKWELDTAYLYYSEKDRVSVFEPVVELKLNLKDEESIAVRVVIDSLTGSSPSGAIPVNTAQTFTTPSSGESYTVPANETPLDPSFLDTRLAVTTTWNKPFSSNFRGVFSAYGSREYDYRSLGASATLSRDFAGKNSTLTGGISLSSDSINPVGDVPLGLSAMPAVGVAKTSTGSDEDKTVVDLLIGWTQVINRKTLMQFNLTYGKDDGYLTDPYKLLTVLTPGGALSGTPYLFEKRPDERTRKTFFWKTIYQVNSSQVLRGSYRYFKDDWGIKSHTVDFRYRFNLGGGKHYIQPHIRYYIQDKADFYYYNLVDTNTPTYASADYRLADMSTTTIGIKYNRELNRRMELGFRLESMTQKSEDSSAPFPDVDAVIFQVNYSVKF